MEEFFKGVEIFKIIRFLKADLVNWNKTITHFIEKLYLRRLDQSESFLNCQQPFNSQRFIC